MESKKGQNRKVLILSRIKLLFIMSLSTRFLISSRWYNLTITNPSYDNLGEYLCVAENNGGVMESKVTLTFDDPSNFIDSTAGNYHF